MPTTDMCRTRPAVVLTATGMLASGLESRQVPAQAAAPSASFTPVSECSSRLLVRLVRRPGPCRSAHIFSYQPLSEATEWGRRRASVTSR